MSLPHPPGMFPYACLSSQLLFCHVDWPRRLFTLIPSSLPLSTSDDCELLPSVNCLYDSSLPPTCRPTDDKYNANNSSSLTQDTAMSGCSEPKLKHRIATVFTILFISLQCFLPYSHGITQGYNNWTNGLYGYSWDMMVHSWFIQVSGSLFVFVN